MYRDPKTGLWVQEHAGESVPAAAANGEIMRQLASQGCTAQVAWGPEQKPLPAENLQQVDGTKIVTHLLLAGRSACGYPAGSAPSWPAGHFWTRAEKGYLVSCPKCQRLVAEVKASGAKAGA